MKSRGIFVVLEGVDRVGKTTQCARLVSELKARGFSAQAEHFPNRQSLTGKLIHQHLQRTTELESKSELKTDPSTLPEQLTENSSKKNEINAKGFDDTDKENGRPVQFQQEINSRTTRNHELTNKPSPPDTSSISASKSKEKIGPETLHLLFSANRWAENARLKKLLESGVSIVCDRYAFSGTVYSSVAGGLDLDWCRGPDRGLVAPDLVFYLRTAAGSALDRLESNPPSLEEIATGNPAATASAAADPVAAPPAGEIYDEEGLQKRLSKAFEEIYFEPDLEPSTETEAEGGDGKSVWRLIDADQPRDAMTRDMLDKILTKIENLPGLGRL